MWFPLFLNGFHKRIRVDRPRSAALPLPIKRLCRRAAGRHLFRMNFEGILFGEPANTGSFAGNRGMGKMRMPLKLPVLGGRAVDGGERFVKEGI